MTCNWLCDRVHLFVEGTIHDPSKGVTIEENFIRLKAEAARSHFQEN